MGESWQVLESRFDFVTATKSWRVRFYESSECSQQAAAWFITPDFHSHGYDRNSNATLKRLFPLPSIETHVYIEKFIYI